MITEPNTINVTDYKKRLIITGRSVISNLIAHANEHVHRYKDFLVDFNKNYIRLIQLQQQSMFSMVKDFRAYCLPRSLDRLFKNKITAPLLSNSIWNIPPDCEKFLFDSNRKRNQFFRGRRPSYRSSYRENRFPKGSSRGSRPLTKKGKFLQIY